MTTPSFSINVFRLQRILDLRSLNIQNFHNETTIIANSLSASPQFTTFQVSLNAIELYNVRYTEKQVRRIDENFSEYSQGIRLTHSIPMLRPPRGLRYLSSKFFSGDVSGQIGEALFVYFLVEELGVNSDSIAHMRPEKRRGYLTSDFLIWDANKRLQNVIGEPYGLPVYGEVKSSTGIMTRDKIGDGLSQLKATIGNAYNHGLLALVSRNQQRSSYDIHFVVVRG